MVHTSQEDERTRVKPLSLYRSTGTERAEQPPLQQSMEHGLAKKNSALASTLPLGSTISKARDSTSPLKSHTRNYSAAEQSPDMLMQSSAKQQQTAGLETNQSLPQYQIVVQPSEYDQLPYYPAQPLQVPSQQISAMNEFQHQQHARVQILAPVSSYLYRGSNARKTVRDLLDAKAVTDASLLYEAITNKKFEQPYTRNDNN